MVYCVSVKHAQDLTKLFTEKGISAGFVSGYQDKKEQTEILRKYHTGEIKILCNADLLIEGFDEPKASVCLNLRPTKSIVLAQQRAGRVLRLDPDNPNKHATIVDFLDKTDDPRKLSVTFAEVAEAAYITTKKVVGNIDGPQVPKGVDVDIPIDTGAGGGFPDKDVIEISGLKVTVNPREVMNIVKKMQEKEFLGFQENDFPITSLSIQSIFKGDSKKLYSLAMRVLESFKQDHPELVSSRLNITRVVEVITDRQKFIEAMLTEGTKMKDDNILSVSPTDFRITANELNQIFSGGDIILKPVALRAKEELVKEYPDLFIERSSGTNTILVCTNREIFIQKMISLGIELKKQEIQKIQPEDLPLTQASLNLLFEGMPQKLMYIAVDVAEEIRTYNPNLIQQRRSGISHLVTVVRDKILFLQLMQARGVELRDQEIQKVNDSDLIISANSLSKVFTGTAGKLLENLKDIVEYFSNLGLTAKRKHPNSGTLVTVVTDRDKFIEAALKAGVKVRSHSTNDLNGSKVD